MINNDSKLAKTFWQYGRDETCPIIDFHGHMGEFRCCYLPRCTADTMLTTMDQCNLQLLLFCGTDTLMMPCLRQQNDIAIVKKYHERFKAYFALNANIPDLKAHLKTLVDNPDVFVGIKMLPDYFHRSINDPAYEPFYNYCNDHHMLFLCHTWDNPKSSYNGPAQAEEFVRNFPNVTFIAGHSFHNNWSEAIRLCNEYSNLYLELTAVLDERGPLEMILKECGSEKILFGTDLPWFDTHHGIGVILSTDMSDEDRKNIFFRNGVKLLSKFDWFKTIWPKKFNSL